MGGLSLYVAVQTFEHVELAISSCKIVSLQSHYTSINMSQYASENNQHNQILEVRSVRNFTTVNLVSH